MLGESARLECPDLPVGAEPLELAVAAERAAPAGADHLGAAFRDPGVHVFLGKEPLAAPADHVVEDGGRNEAGEFFVAHHVGVLEEVVLAPGATVGHQDCRGVVGLGARHVLGDVVVDGDDGQAVLVAREAVRHLRQVQLQVERAFGGGDEFVLHRGHRDPLADDPVADHVLLDGDRVVGLGVALQEIVGGLRVVHP